MLDSCVEHWNRIRNAPNFGHLSDNIKPQQLAYELVPILQEKIGKLQKIIEELENKLND